MEFLFDPSLVLYLPLYQLDAASFSSRDVYGHLCTRNGALWRTDGHYFDGVDDALSCPDHSALNMTGAITIEVWAKPVGDSEDYGRYICKMNQYYLGQEAGDETNVRWELFLPGSSVLNSGTGIVRAEMFNHIAGTYDRYSQKRALFVDSKEVASDSRSASINTDSNLLRIGEVAAGAQNFRGIIGEIRIYSRALSPVEVQHNYLATKWRYR